MKVFFFSFESPRMLALVRIVLGLALLYDGLSHWRNAIELFSTFGPAMPVFVQEAEVGRPTPIFADRGGTPKIVRVKRMLPIPVLTPEWAVIAHTFLVVSMLSVTLGWHSRTSLVAAFVVALWLWPLDLSSSIAKHTVIALHLLLLLVFSQCGAVWSLDALADANRNNFCRLSSAGPRRLMQILVCCIYFGATLTKIKTPTFANGDLLTFSFLDDHWGSGRIGLWLSTVPFLTLGLSKATLLFELLFPFLVWVRRCRLPLVGLAFGVHAAMGLLLHLKTFSPIMFAALLAFIEERDLVLLARAIRDPFRRVLIEGAGGVGRAAPSNAHAGLHGAHARFNFASSARWHVIAVILFVAAGFAIQYIGDWYGAFGRRSPEALKEISTDEFDEMLAQRGPAYEDYFHRIELGSRFSGNQVFGSSQRFQTGQRAYVLIQMIQSHPAMTLEGILIAADGKELARFTHRVDPGNTYTVNGFELTSELLPGTYGIVLQAEGYVVAERQFELVH